MLQKIVTMIGETNENALEDPLVFREVCSSMKEGVRLLGSLPWLEEQELLVIVRVCWLKINFRRSMIFHRKFLRLHFRLLYLTARHLAKRQKS